MSLEPREIVVLGQILLLVKCIRVHPLDLGVEDLHSVKTDTTSPLKGGAPGFCSELEVGRSRPLLISDSFF